MRLFVAITPPPEALAEIEALTAPLQAAWPGLRWTGSDAWHITLAFLGEVSEDVLAELRAQLEQAAGEHGCLELSLSGAGAFPDALRARVLWAGVAGDRVALTALAQRVAEAARLAGAPPPDGHRTYRPHLTLARCREPAEIRRLVGELATISGQPWPAGQIQLIRSDPGSQPRYTAAGAWPLRPPSVTAASAR